MKTSFFPTLTKQHLGLQLCRKQQLCSTSGTILAKSDTFCQQTIKGKQRCFVSHFKRKSGNGQRKRNNKVHTLQRNKTTGARLRLTGLTLGIENCSTRLRLTLQSKDSALLLFFFYICISRWRKRIDGLSVWDVVTPVALPPVNCRERGQTHKHRSSACSFFFFLRVKKNSHGFKFRPARKEEESQKRTSVTTGRCSARPAPRCSPMVPFVGWHKSSEQQGC